MMRISGGRNLKLAMSFSALLLCSACGGGGGSSAPISTPATSVNRAPVVTTVFKSVITEGQPFELDASQSSDSDGDSLTYSWRQVSGPTIEIASVTESKLALTAPLLDADESVSFEVSVTDGALTSTSTVTLDLEDMKTESALSEATEYGTGGPQNPQQTIADPSIYEGNKPLDRIIGLTPTETGGYIVHWTASNAGRDMPVSSQAFTADGEKVGEQVDGVYLGGDRGTYERDGRTYNRFEYGASFATIQSGDTLFNLNVRLEFSESFTLDYTSTRGLVEGEVDGFGDIWREFGQFSQKTMAGAFTPIGESNVLITLSERTTEEADDEAAEVMMTSLVLDKFGQAVTHELGQYVSNGTTNDRNWMTVAAYQTDSYLTAWAQNTADNGYDVRMQRGNEDGILLGEQVTVNAETDGDQLYPIAETMSGGDVLVVWASMQPDGTEVTMRARLIGPDGRFLTDEVALPPALPDFDDNTLRNKEFFTLTALNTDEVLLTWKDETSGSPEIRAFVLDGDLNIISNEFLIATGSESDKFSNVQSLVMPDNRVILGWYNNYDYRDERPDTSHTVGFYPVGRE